MKILDIFLPYQKKFFTNPAKRKIWVSSRQVGKSFCIASILAYKALSKPNGLSICISVNSRSAAEIITKCKLFAESIKVLSEGKIDYTASFDSIKFSTGLRIMSLPSTADSLRGWSATCVCIDEAAFVWKLDDILQGIAPTLTRDKDAELILTTTPAGCNGAFYELYSKALDDEAWYVQHTTIEDAINDGLNIEIESLRSLCPDPDVFALEYMCKFSKEFGLFLDFDILDFYNDIPKGKSSYYLGMDIGRHNDKTGIVILNETNGNLYLENIMMLSKCEYALQIETIKQLHSKYKFTGGFIDAGGIGSAVAELITKTISSKLKGVLFTGSNKTPMYEAVRAKVFDHKLFFNPEFKDLIKEDFRNVHRLVLENGTVKFEAGRDSNGHSDFSSALVLAVEALKLMPASFSMPSTYARQSAFGGMSHIF